MEIAIYNENCLMKGSEVPQRILENYVHPREETDWSYHEVSEENIKFWENRGLFGERVANTLKKYV